ncbi:MAG: carboxylic acid reductase [Sphingobium phenoxybenzoativorans]
MATKEAAIAEGKAIADLRETELWDRGSDALEVMAAGNAGSDFVQRRLKELRATDEQFRNAIPDAEVTRAKLDPSLGLAQLVAMAMEAYADRPAVGQRATQLVHDPRTGRTSRELLDHYESFTYADIWERARALAAMWHRDEKRSLRAYDKLCVMAFAGVDFTIADLAAIHNGTVVVPIQTNGALSTLQGIVQEVEPRWMAVSLENLNTAVELVLTAHRPAGLLLFDYHPEVDSERETLEAASARLREAGIDDLIVTIDDAYRIGRTVEPAPLFAEEDTHKKLCTIYYTSGSTGLPKGVMWPEMMLKPMWRMHSEIPFLYMHYMPMNHAFGRSGVYTALNTGGTCFFTAKSDLSTLFQDIALVRPTFLGLVTRICEMVYQQFQAEFERRAPSSSDHEALRQELILHVRNKVLGGRLLSCNFGSAPIAPDLREFIETCMGVPLDEYFAITETVSILRNGRAMKPPVIDIKLIDVPELGYFTTDKPHPRGEMLVKTNSLMLGYYKRPEATEKAIDKDNYYHTGDIMAEDQPGHYVYVDRRNNVQKLAQGEFVAISHLEGVFNNGHPIMSQVFLYGSSSRSYLLAVIVPNRAVLDDMGIAGDDAAIRAEIRKALQEIARNEKLNAYEVPRDFILEHEPFSTINGLLAGVGKYARPNLKAHYGPGLEQFYDDIAAAQAGELKALRSQGRDAPVLETVVKAIQATLGIEKVDPSKPANFSELGGDSLSALTCSLLLEEIFDVEVPSDVINNPAGSLQQIADYITRMLSGVSDRATFASVHGRGATEIAASDLTLEKFIDAETLAGADAIAPPSDNPQCILITGANGYLGRFLCLEWLERMAAAGGRVIAIVRGRDNEAARKRLAAAYDSDPDLKQHFDTLAAGRLEVIAGDLAEPRLGLSDPDWSRLADTVDLIVHPGALVNHVLPYAQMFAANVAGTAELIRLAVTGRMKPIHNVSTQVVAAMPGGSMLAEDADVRAATPVRTLNSEAYADGYNHSKWAGEVLLREAHDALGLPVAVFRSDMIMAHSRYRGQLNASDLLTRLFLSVALTGLVPRSFYRASETKAHFDGLPVDFIAKSIAAIGPESTQGYRTFHVANAHDDGISLDTFMDWIAEAGHPVVRVDGHEEWYHRFETALKALPEDKRAHSSIPLLQLLREPLPAASGSDIPSGRFTDAVRKADQDVPHLSQALIRKYLDDLHALNIL